jgi:hypothetical protein
LQIDALPDPDPSYPFDADPDPTFQFDADPCGSLSATMTGAEAQKQKEQNQREQSPSHLRSKADEAFDGRMGNEKGKQQPFLPVCMF